MAQLRLLPEHARCIIDQALAALPNEVCGIIVGQGQNASQVIPITNIAKHPLTQFHMDPVELFQALRKSDADGQNFLGIYHSHPKTAPIPSPTDIRAIRSAMPGTLCLILSLHHGQRNFKLWQISTEDIDDAQLIISHHSAFVQTTQPLSRAHRFAIVIAAITASLLLIGLSIALLPPAPNISELLP